ncbi:hypothetical protein HRI_000105400 [Hibiscus trionum]|uniref:Agglutinin domain-containing protein n=1 Tax=Hibiscus trionum TaxID=183268 RepID=A0A9W7GUL5_HIBTR|nr:hypothetical protein HRI_000105400 [Hibiscus trionum]
MASALVLASDVRVPRFFTLEFGEYGSYSTYVRDGGEMDGCIKFEEGNVESPYTKFEAEAAGADGLFHIRSCQNNKYWERKKIQHKDWITATAKKKEENQTKASCTLFKFITVDAFMKTVRILHVQSGNYLCLSTSTDRCASADYNVVDHEGHDILQLIDWRSMVVLPKYVAFKGDNGKYLRHRPQNPRWDYLEFSANDLGDPTVPCEVSVFTNGNVRIRSLSNNKFWRLSPNWIWADSYDTSITDTLFRPYRVDDTTIALMNLRNNRFCRRLTADRKTDCLNAAVNTIIRETRLTVEEPVLSREINDVQYKVDDARVYDESVIVVARNTASNHTQQSSTFSVKLSYSEEKTTTWNSSLSLKLGMKATARFRIPLIVNGKIEISSEVQSVTEWGKTTTITTAWEIEHKVVVPPMTKVTVNLVATKGHCDVPFTYMQKDTLYDGKIVTTKIEGASYTGSNYYSNDFVVREEKL